MFPRMFSLRILSGLSFEPFLRFFSGLSETFPEFFSNFFSCFLLNLLFGLSFASSFQNYLRNHPLDSSLRIQFWNSEILPFLFRSAFQCFFWNVRRTVFRSHANYFLGDFSFERLELLDWILPVHWYHPFCLYSTIKFRFCNSEYCPKFTCLSWIKYWFSRFLYKAVDIIAKKVL